MGSIFNNIDPTTFTLIGENSSRRIEKTEDEPQKHRRLGVQVWRVLPELER
jgi:hypothetical protein